MKCRSNFERVVSQSVRERAHRSWMAMLRGDKPFDHRRLRRCLRALEAEVIA